MPLVRPSSINMAVMEESMQAIEEQSDWKSVPAPQREPAQSDRELRCHGLPVAVLDRQHDAGVGTQTEVIGSAVVERALGDLNVAGIFQRILQGGAERGGSRLGFLQCHWYDTLQHQLRIVDVSGKQIATTGAILMFVALYEIGGELLRWIAVRQGFRHYRRARDDESAFHITTAQTDQIA